MMGDKHFPASLVDLPCVVESYKTYDDQTLIKTADVGQVTIISTIFVGYNETHFAIEI